MIKKITAIVLTRNEEIHIRRCLENLNKIDANVKLIDSGSTDSTLSIAKEYSNVEIYYNKWINYSSQFNWAINNCSINTEWVLRIDADEFMDDDLIRYVNKLEEISNEITGVYVCRGIYFMGKNVKYGEGGVWHLKIWRNGSAYCQQKWMDEHMVQLYGNSCRGVGFLYDDNRHSLDLFIQKHNSYATREALDYFLLYENEQDNSDLAQVSSHSVKKLYYKAPIFLRPILYYIYIMIFRLGVASGPSGIIYHTLQKLMYRFIVDAKIFEARRKSKEYGISPVEYLRGLI